MLHKTDKTWTLARPLPRGAHDMAATWQAVDELPGRPMTDEQREVMRALFSGELDVEAARMMVLGLSGGVC